MALTDKQQQEIHQWAGRSHHELVAEVGSLRNMVAATRYESAVTQQKLDRLIAKLGA